MTVHSIETIGGAVERRDHAARPAFRRLVLAPVAGLVAGSVLGGVARGWMRLLADDPEFTWSGTIFIVGAFAVTGFGHALAWATRRATERRWLTTVARLAGGTLTLSLFVGAGAMMLPTVVGASLGRWRRDWGRVVRLTAAAIAAPVPIGFVVAWWRDGMHLRSGLGLALLAATYAVIVTTAQPVVAPIVDGWRMPRRLRVAAVVAAVTVTTAIALLVAGLATG